MNILIVANYSSPYSGNFIPSILTLSRLLESRGNRVHYAFPKQAKNKKWFTDLFAEARFLFFDKESRISEALNINKYIKANNIDLLYTHFTVKFLPVLIFLNRNIKVVRHVHTDMGDNTSRMLLVKLKIRCRLVYRKCTNIYVSEKLMKEENNELSYFVPNAICSSRFVNDNKDKIRDSIRKELNISSDDIVR